MAKNPSPMIDGPIAGMSMTAEMGSRPWQKPPKYSTVEEAVEFYLPRLTDEETYDSILDVMEMGIPLTTIAESMQVSGSMEGLHTLDVGILVMPVIIEMLAYIGDDAGIEYNLGIEARIDEDKIESSKIALAMKKIRERMPEELEDMKQEEEEVAVDIEPVEDTEDSSEQLSGLMARRT